MLFAPHRVSTIGVIVRATETTETTGQHKFVTVHTASLLSIILHIKQGYCII
jgi:hypothetical protein